MTDKYCIECKHHKQVKQGKGINLGIFGCVVIPIEINICYRNAKYSRVDKSSYEETILACDTEREDALRLEQFRCGKDGKYWEPK